MATTRFPAPIADVALDAAGRRAVSVDAAGVVCVWLVEVTAALSVNSVSLETLLGRRSGSAPADVWPDVFPVAARVDDGGRAPGALDDDDAWARRDDAPRLWISTRGGPLARWQCVLPPPPPPPEKPKKGWFGSSKKAAPAPPEPVPTDRASSSARCGFTSPPSRHAYVGARLATVEPAGTLALWDPRPPADDLDWTGRLATLVREAPCPVARTVVLDVAPLPDAAGLCVLEHRGADPGDVLAFDDALVAASVAFPAAGPRVVAKATVAYSVPRERAGADPRTCGVAVAGGFLYLRVGAAVVFGHGVGSPFSPVAVLDVGAAPIRGPGNAAAVAPDAVVAATPRGAVLVAAPAYAPPASHRGSPRAFAGAFFLDDGD
ncbi:hypothetical protein JL721_6345 [Aureococcus anophagefferens]|nr:hypothetical protein JL721_6345 [Aureococcus anophagefferens]